jgi:transposase-like protein
MMAQFAVTDFFKRFPDDDSCLNHLMSIRFGFELDCPKCSKHGKFSRIKGQPAFQCAWCSHHIHPMAGTPFERSRTPLQKWFYAMYLFTTTRHGVSAKELQRQLAVTYKCAWRIGHEIRKYMAETDGDDGLSGHVEIDETYIGGKDNVMGRPTNKNSKKTGVFGMVERDGNLMTKVIPNAKGKRLHRLINTNIEAGSRISSDDYRPYRKLKGLGYDHQHVNHSVRQWVKGDTHTQTIEGVWSQLKRSIRGTHVHVSRKHLPKYLGEFEYRYNMRGNPEAMFSRLLLSF